MQRIARLFVVLVVVASTLNAIPARAQKSATVTIDLFLSGDDLIVRDGAACLPLDGVGASTIALGEYSETLEHGIFFGVSESPTTRAGCRFSVGLAAKGAEPYAVMVGETEVGFVTAAELARLDHRLEIAIRSADLIVESRDWRFSDREAVIASAPTPTSTSGRRTTTQHRSTPTPTPSSRSSRGTTTTTDRWGCADLQDYQDEILSRLRSVDEVDAVQDFISADDFTTLRPSVLRRASEGLDEWAGLLEKMDDVPLAAQEYHENLINYASLTSIILVSYASGGVFAIVPYTDAMDAISSDRDAAKRLGERRCGDEWTDVFGS